MTVGFHHGALCDPYEKQANEQGFTLGDKATPLQECGDGLLYDEDIIREYAEVLRRPKFKFSESLIVTLLQAITTYGMSVERLATGEQLIDPKDLVFYEVAMAKQDDNAYLITGNKRHFPIKTFIVTSTEMLEIMEKDE